MNKKKVVFITNFHPFVTKNTLNSGVLDHLANKAQTVVIFVYKDKEDYFKNIYEKDNVLVEGVDLKNEIGSFINRIFARLAEWSLDTNVMRFHKLEAFQKVGRPVKFYFSLIFTKIFSHLSLVRRTVRWLDYKCNNPKSLQHFFKQYQPDVMVATDVFDDLNLFFLKMAKSLGVKNVSMLRSWDNTTSRGYLRFVPDKLIVHNEIGKKDMLKYHNISEDIIYLSGIPQFEKYLGMEPASREEFYKKMGADIKKRLVLFAPAGHFFIDTDWQICQILKDLYHEKKIPQDVQFVIRLHPFLPVDLSHFVPDENFVIDVPGPAQPNQLAKDKKEGELDKSFFQHIFDSLHHSSLVINSVSSIIIDTAIFDKPLITINFDGWEAPQSVAFLRSLPRRWRFEENQISWMSFGMTPLVESKEELALWINKYLDNPSLDSDKRKVFKQTYCWKFDGKAAERITEICLK
ncbi:MAG: CDP-glycerol glycerophosphotransferase family protein [bacterium]|nr:CDP-glycerol glycerophosphotransferase family protein [bacterium]